MPKDLLYELISYFSSVELIELCQENIMPYHNVCSSDTFWSKILENDFEWEDDALQTSLDEYSARELYTYITYIAEYDEHFEEPIEDFDFMDLLELINENFSEQPSQIEKIIINFLMDRNDDRDIFLRNVSNLPTFSFKELSDSIDSFISTDMQADIKQNFTSKDLI